MTTNRHGAPVFVQGSAANIPCADESFQAAACSPPFWKARDYGHGPDQLGFEDSVAEYVTHLCDVLEETRRVLRRDGTLWLNIGDSYNTRAKIRERAHNPGLGHSEDEVGESASLSWRQMSERGLVKHSSRAGSGLKDKDLAMVPSRVAIELVSRGWFLRATIIWSKPWGKPERAFDRPSQTHEYVFMLTRSERYKFHKTEAVSRSVWEIPPTSGIQGLRGPAVFPSELVRRCLSASTDPGDWVLDPFAGSGVTLHTAHDMGRCAMGIDLTTEWWDASLSDGVMDVEQHVTEPIPTLFAG